MFLFLYFSGLPIVCSVIWCFNCSSFCYSLLQALRGWTEVAICLCVFCLAVVAAALQMLHLFVLSLLLSLGSACADHSGKNVDSTPCSSRLQNSYAITWLLPCCICGTYLLSFPLSSSCFLPYTHLQMFQCEELSDMFVFWEGFCVCVCGIIAIQLAVTSRGKTWWSTQASMLWHHSPEGFFFSFFGLGFCLFFSCLNGQAYFCRSQRGWQLIYCYLNFPLSSLAAPRWPFFLSLDMWVSRMLCLLLW